MKGLEMVKCESLRMNMYRITHTGKSMNFPVTKDSNKTSSAILNILDSLSDENKANHVCFMLLMNFFFGFAESKDEDENRDSKRIGELEWEMHREINDEELGKL